MFKIVFRIIKRIVIAFVLLYSFNVFISALHILIPINYISLLVVALLGIPGLVGLLAMYLVIF